MFWPRVDELPDVAVESKTLPPKSEKNNQNCLEQTFSN
jgi:hypothetical protein